MNSSIKLTVTGFGPFHNVERNPSEDLVRRIETSRTCHPQFEVSTAVFPVVYDGAGKRIETVLEDTQPDILLMTGVHAQAGAIQLERVARNADDSETPDNAGEVRQGKPILSGAATDRYVSDLPLEKFASALNASRPVAEVSDDAGGFICNHYYYLARSILQARKSSCRCLFVHIPDLPCIDMEGRELSIGIASDAMLTLTSMISDLQFALDDS